MSIQEAWDLIHTVGGVRRAKDIIFNKRFTQSLDGRDLCNRLEFAIKTLAESGEITK